MTVDNGISALEEAEFAASLGVDLIVTDHHLPMIPCLRPLLWWTPAAPMIPAPSRACAAQAWLLSSVPRWTAAA